MQIQIDSREKARAITKIVAEFDKQKIKYFVSKMYVGDYVSLDNPRLVIDRKQNLSELALNLFQGRRRFYDEIIRASKSGIKMIILCEHGGSIKSIKDVGNWVNPRIKESPKAITGRDLMEKLYSLHISYGVEVIFCTKAQTGAKIIELLKKGEINGEGTDT